LRIRLPGRPVPWTAAFLTRQLLLLLALYTVLRLTFMGIHLDLYLPHRLTALGEALLHGLRFDLAAIALSNIPLVLLALAPRRVLERRGYQRLLKGCFVGVNTFMASVMVADLEYSSFTGSRITLELLHLDSGVGMQVAQAAVDHFPLLLLAGAMGVLLFRLYPDPWNAKGRRAPGLASAALGRLTLVALVVVAARGGLQDKVLEPIHAFHSADQELGLLTLNSAFTLIKSPLQPELEILDFFPADRDVERILRSSRGYRAAHAGPQNVVVIILESLGTEFWGAANGGRGLTPFLDSLAAEGLFLTNHFANGRRSIEALPSVLLGVPALMSNPLAKSSFQGNEWVGLGHLMEGAGYHTSFFHGARRGTMYFDVIARMAGMRDYHPLERYPADLQDRDFDGHWGLFDEPFLLYAVEEIGRQPAPFFSTIFTISTHNPFVVPEEYAAVLPEGEQEIHRSVRYVDRALRAFFQAARREEWFANTLFVLTGDHTQSSPSPEYDTLLGRYMVPLLLYHPGETFAGVDPQRITQQVDLFPTILDYAGVEAGRIPLFGRSIFSLDPGEAILQNNGVHWLVRPEGVVQRDPAGIEEFYRFERQHTRPEPVQLPREVQQELSRRLRAHLQHFNNSLVMNSFYRTRVEGPAPGGVAGPAPQRPPTGGGGAGTHLL
jgi:hypothetical protein